MLSVFRQFIIVCTDYCHVILVLQSHRIRQGFYSSADTLRLCFFRISNIQAGQGFFRFLQFFDCLLADIAFLSLSQHLIGGRRFCNRFCNLILIFQSDVIRRRKRHHLFFRKPRQVHDFVFKDLQFPTSCEFLGIFSI